MRRDPIAHGLVSFRRESLFHWIIYAVWLFFMIVPPAGAAHARQAIDGSEILKLRKQLKHEEALEILRAAQDGEKDTVLLSVVTLELSLLEKLGPRTKRFVLKRRGALARLATLDLSGTEEVTLSGLCYLLGLEEDAEEALIRARTKSPELKIRTDEILAEHRGEDIPRGGYFRYRGGFLPMEDRDLERALDQAVEGLYALDLKGLMWRFIPSSAESNRERFVAQYGDEGPEFLRSAASLLRDGLKKIHKEVRSWIPSYSSSSLRRRIQQKLDELDPIRKDDLALIGRYDKPEQPQVDEYREELEALYPEYVRLVDANFARVRNINPERGYELWKQVNAYEDVLADIDRYLKACSLPGLGPVKIAPGRGADVTRAHLLPGREQSSLEDVLWLVMNFTAGRTLDVLQRSEELLRQKDEMTPWERWIVRRMKIESVERYNRQAAISCDAVEREYFKILNGYRKMLGLLPFEVEERLIVAARKHSQEMVDLNYFGHISPVRRNRTPTDRVKLEGYGGGVGENCLVSSGFVSARGAFEGWYHSPGHHRLLVSTSEQSGTGAADGHRMWTMVAGGLDRSWLQLHKDLVPERRAELVTLAGRFSEETKKGPPSDDTVSRLESSLSSILSFVAKEAFESVHSGSATSQQGAPGLLSFLIRAKVPLEWRPLQVAAVAAGIDLMDTGESIRAREAAFDLITHLVSSDHGYDPAAPRNERRPAVVEIRKEWEDEAQWQYLKLDPDQIHERETPVGREGDGPSLKAPLRVLSGQERLRLAKLHGGGTHTERAVDLGLRWLAGVQSEDGAWRARSFATRLSGDVKPGRFGQGNAEHEIAMTGLSMLALIYGGNTTLEGEYSENVERGARFLISRITDYGMFDTVSSHYMYGHAMATQALCELYAYTADPYIGVCAQLCVDYLVYAQDPHTGGWRYRAKEAGDTSVSGWVVLALHSAQKAQIDIAGIRDALRFLNSVTYTCYFEVGYTNRNNGGQNRISAAGILSRLFITGKKKRACTIFNGRRFLRDLPRKGGEDFYYWYYATLFMFQMGDDYWKPWNEALMPALLNNQEQDPDTPLYGSFNPRGQYSGNGGRIYQTTLGLLMLMTYYRYDRALKPKLVPSTGNIQKKAEPYMEALKRSEHAVVKDVTERKMVDRFGPALASVLIKELKKGDGEEEFRQRLASMLCRSASAYCEPHIFELLADESDDKVRELLMKALDSICTLESVPRLVDYLDDNNRMVRGYCASALGRIGDDKGAVMPLSERLDAEKDGWCRAKIEEALQRLAYKDALTKILDDALAGDDAGRLVILEKLEVMERTGLAKMFLSMKATEPRIYEGIKEAMRMHKEWAAVPMTIVGLESSDLDTRSESVKLLRAFTRLNHRFDPSASKPDRVEAIERWRDWWKESIDEYQF